MSAKPCHRLPHLRGAVRRAAREPDTHGVGAVVMPKSTRSSARSQELRSWVRELEEELVCKDEVVRALMQRVERSIDAAGNSFALFESNIVLQQMVDERTEQLESVNDLLRRNTVREREKAARGSRGGEPGQERLPGEHEPRDPHAAEWRARHAAAARRPVARYGEQAGSPSRQPCTPRRRSSAWSTASSTSPRSRRASCIWSCSHSASRA